MVMWRFISPIAIAIHLYYVGRSVSCGHPREDAERGQDVLYNLRKEVEATGRYVVNLNISPRKLTFAAGKNIPEPNNAL